MSQMGYLYPDVTHLRGLISKTPVMRNTMHRANIAKAASIRPYSRRSEVSVCLTCSLYADAYPKHQKSIPATHYETNVSEVHNESKRSERANASLYATIGDVRRNSLLSPLLGRSLRTETR